MNVTYAPPAAPGNETDWTEPTQAPAGTFSLTDDATAQGVAVARAFVDAIQDEDLNYDDWLSRLQPLLRADAFERLTGSKATADRFQWGSNVADPELKTFDTGRLLGVTFNFDTGELYVTLTRETAEQPWRVAWWE